MGEANKACVNRLQREYRALLKVRPVSRTLYCNA